MCIRDRHRAEPEGENYYSTLRQFMNDQVEIVSCSFFTFVVILILKDHCDN